MFSKQTFLRGAQKKSLVAKLGLEEKHIKSWFQNRRNRFKKANPDKIYVRGDSSVAEESEEDEKKSDTQEVDAGDQDSN